MQPLPLLILTATIFILAESRQPEPYTRFLQRSSVETVNEGPTAPQCCKVGERLGNRQLPCPGSYFNTLTSRAFKPMMPFHRSSASKLDTEVGRCVQRHRKVTEKCCYYATTITSRVKTDRQT